MTLLAGLLAELHRRDRRVLAVHAAGDHHAREALGRLGVDAAVPDSATAEELVEAIVALALAGVVAARCERTVLVDADEVAPSLAQRMASPLVPNQPSLTIRVRAVSAPREVP